MPEQVAPGDFAVVANHAGENKEEDAQDGNRLVLKRRHGRISHQRARR